MGLADMGMMPPLQLSLGSSASAGAYGGSTAGGGMGALNEGNWTIETTGAGNNSATATSSNTPAGQAAAVSATAHPLLVVALAVGAWWMLKHK